MPTSWRASFTSSSLNGLMIASIFFIPWAPDGASWRSSAPDRPRQNSLGSAFQCDAAGGAVARTEFSGPPPRFGQIAASVQRRKPPISRSRLRPERCLGARRRRTGLTPSAGERARGASAPIRRLRRIAGRRDSPRAHPGSGAAHGAGEGTRTPTPCAAGPKPLRLPVPPRRTAAGVRPRAPPVKPAGRIR